MHVEELRVMKSLGILLFYQQWLWDKEGGSKSSLSSPSEVDTNLLRAHIGAKELQIRKLQEKPVSSPGIQPAA